MISVNQNTNHHLSDTHCVFDMMLSTLFFYLGLVTTLWGRYSYCRFMFYKNEGHTAVEGCNWDSNPDLSKSKTCFFAIIIWLVYLHIYFLNNLLKWNLQNTKPVILNWVIEWQLVHSQCVESPPISNYKTFWFLQSKKLYLNQFLHITPDLRAW